MPTTPSSPPTLAADVGGRVVDDETGEEL